nr:MAG TPA: hypothetical protein [Caudoviricetes sp.]
MIQTIHLYISTDIEIFSDEARVPKYSAVRDLNNFVLTIRHLVKLCHQSGCSVKCHERSDKVEPSSETAYCPYKHTYELDIRVDCYNPYSYHYFLAAVESACDFATQQMRDYAYIYPLSVSANIVDEPDLDDFLRSACELNVDNHPL